MGKTITSLLTIAAAIAVNVIPGVGQFLSAAIGSTLATAAVSAITVAGLQSAFGLIAGGGGAKPETSETAIKTSRPPRVSAYGRSRLYGAYTLFETASDGTAVDVFAVHEGKIDGIEARYLADEAVAVDGGGTVAAGADGRYKNGAIHIYTTDGSVPGAGFPALAALLPGVWTAAHRGDGVVMLAVTAKSVKAKHFQETYPHSSVPVASIVARWQLCPDPAAVDPLNEAAWTWTENPVRHLLHYKLVREGPRPALARSDPGYPAALAALRLAWWNRKIAPTLDYWIAAAAVCDEPRALAAGGNEAKYRSAVSHKHTDRHAAPISALLATFDGWLMPRSDGALVVYAGKYYPPTVTIGPDEIVTYTYDAGEPDEGEAANEIICSYISAAHDYNVVECDAWRDEADITARGKVLSLPLDAQVPSHAQSRYLAKRLMARRSAPARGVITTNIAGRSVMGHRFVELTLEEAGTLFYSGPVEITAMRRTLRGGVTFEWVAADPTVDNWTPALEEGPGAADGPRVPSLPLDAPTIDDIDAIYTQNAATGTPGVRLAVFGTGPDREDLTWYVRWRVEGDTTWQLAEFPDEAPGAAVQVVTDFVAAAQTLEVSLQYQIGDGRYSPISDVALTSTRVHADTTLYRADTTSLTADLL